MRILPLIVSGMCPVLGMIVLADNSALADGPAELLRQAETKYGQGKYAEAAGLASQVIDGEAIPLEAYRFRAAAYEQLRQFDAAIADLDRYIKRQAESAEAYQERGMLHFKAGHVQESIADFDRFLEFRPGREPHHWQRGISYYYAGRYERGVKQFELHKSVNSQDVENAIWHYLCKARVDGVKDARAALIDINHDSRPWAMAVHRMFQGRETPQQVIAHAERVSRTDAEKKYNLFYAQLYVGLLHEAAGHTEDALKHIRIAVEKYPSAHYMGDVARVHLQLARAKEE